MANTLRFKRGLVATIPTAVAGEPLFTTDTFDLYIGNGTTNTRFQKYIASGSTSQLIRGDGSLLTMPIVLTSPTSGQVLKYNGTSWVNDSDSGVTGTGTTNYLPKWTSGSAIGNSLVYDSGTAIGIGTATPNRTLTINGLIGINNGTANTQQFVLYIDANAAYLTSSYVGSSSYVPIAFEAGGFERARITTTGNLLVNSTTDNGNRLQVTGNGYFSGNVGIGTSSPGAKLDVYTSVGWNPIYTTSNTIYAGIVADSAAAGLDIHWKSGNPLRFSTSTAKDGTAYSEKMRLDSSGNLGLGVTPSAWNSDAKALQVSTGSIFSGTGYAFFGQNHVYSPSGDIFLGTGYATTYGQANGVHKWLISTASGTAGNAISFTQAMTLTSGGNLLVGTSVDAGYKLDINGSARVSGNLQVTTTSGNGITITTNDVTTLKMNSTGGTKNWGFATTNLAVNDFGIYQSNAAGGDPISAGASKLYFNGTTGAATFSSSVTATSFNGTTNNIFSVGGTERMRISSGGNLGINNTSTLAKLHVTGNLLSYSEAANTAALFIAANNSYNWQFGINNGSDYVITENGGVNAIGTTRLSVKPGGNVLIGTTTDTGYKLNVNGGIYGKGITADADSTVGNAIYGYGQVLSGSSTNALVQLDTTWNTTGNANAIDLNVTNTASGASSKLLNLKVDLASVFSVSKGGAVQTSAPSGGTAKPWKLGKIYTDPCGIPTTFGQTMTDQYIELEIDGVFCYVPIRVPGWC